MHKNIVGLKSFLILVAFSTVSLLAILIAVFLVRNKTFSESFAATILSIFEAESGARAGEVLVKSDTSASGGQYIEFGPSTTNVNFQPQAPYYANFYYMWYKSASTDGVWSYWQDSGNNPPNTWFGHFMPDPNPTSFDPANELYSSNNYEIFKWQVAKMAEAKQEVAIASWWGQNTKEDVAFNNIINSFMGRADNSYPNLRWSMYYEDEGFSDPGVATIVSDLNYIKNKFTQSPYYFKISGKPVLFVYAGANDTTGMNQRWKEANTQTGNHFYIVLKLYSGYASTANQPDSWHQYAPAVRSGGHSPHSYFVSPGFWLDDGSSERLTRNATEFENAVKSMVSASTQWKLVETWNEWGEGTSVEPGVLTQINSTVGREEISTSTKSSYMYRNLYIDILARNLPALEAGTGR